MSAGDPTAWEGGPGQGEQAWTWGARSGHRRGLAVTAVQVEHSRPRGLSPWRHVGARRVLSRTDRAARLRVLCPPPTQHPSARCTPNAEPTETACSSANPRRHGRGVPHPPHGPGPQPACGEGPGKSGTSAEWGHPRHGDPEAPRSGSARAPGLVSRHHLWNFPGKPLVLQPREGAED